MEEDLQGLIYERWLEHCAPFPPLPEWSTLRIDRNAYIGPADPPAALADLCARFSEEDLIASSIAQRSPEGALIVSPKLAAPRTPLLAWRRTSKSRPFDLLTDEGLLATSLLPAVMVLNDGWTEAAAEWPNLVCVAFSLVDAIILRSLGIPATTAYGLDRIGTEELNQLTDDFTIGEPELALAWSEHGADPDVHTVSSEGPSTMRDDSDTPADGDGKPKNRQHNYADCDAEVDMDTAYNLVLAPWSLLALGEPTSARAEAVIEDLRRLNEQIQFGFFQIGIWRPTEKERQTFRDLYLRDAKSTIWLRKAVRQSLLDSQTPILPTKSEPAPEEPPDLAAAWENLNKMCYCGSTTPESAEQKRLAIREVLRLLQRDFVAPLMHDACTCKRQGKKQLKLMFAQMTQASFMQMVNVLRRHAQSIKNASADPAWREDVKLLLTLADQSLKFHQTLESLAVRKSPLRRRQPPCLPPPSTGPRGAGLANDGTIAGAHRATRLDGSTLDALSTPPCVFRDTSVASARGPFDRKETN